MEACTYHKRVHRESAAEAHAYCSGHGHCIAGPLSCTWHKISQCPAHMNEHKPIVCPRHKCVHTGTDATHAACTAAMSRCIAGPADCTRYLDCPRYGAVQMRRHTYVKTNEKGYYLAPL